MRPGWGWGLKPRAGLSRWKVARLRRKHLKLQRRTTYLMRRSAGLADGTAATWQTDRTVARRVQRIESVDRAFLKARAKLWAVSAELYGPDWEERMNRNT